jgi:hypothetical protein
MRRGAALVVLATLALAGCGGGAKHAAPKPPRLPRALAQAWAQQADGVAGALAAGDSCTAQQLAGTLRAEIVQAVNARQIPHAFEESLLATSNDLTGRIVCSPPPEKSKHKHGKHGGGD